MIYFGQWSESGLIKIGCSIRVDLRLQNLEHQYQQPLSLLYTMKGDRQTEREIHGRFCDLRVKLIDRRDSLHWTEWFWPGADLMAFIGLPIFAVAKPVGQELVVESRWRAKLHGRPVYWRLITDDGPAPRRAKKGGK